MGLSRFRERVGLLRDAGQLDPSGHVHATSTCYNAEGKVTQQWVKRDHGTVDRDAIAAAIKDALVGFVPPKAKPAPRTSNADLLAVYGIGDMHVGMYSWFEETGADFDLKIAERLLASAMSHLVNVTPATDRCLFLDVGDFGHYDTIKQETVRSHNTLDCDSRHHAMIRCILRMLVAGIDLALTKHKTVEVICAPGNHNDMGAAWQSESLALYYSKEPRVKVHSHAAKFFYVEHGKTLIGATHGDTGKPEKLGGVMAVDQPEAWGRTRHRYWLTGHVHNKSVMDLPGCTWETFRTLAPVDAWAAGAGYRSGRDMQAIVYHKDHGEVGRNRFDVSMMEAA